MTDRRKKLLCVALLVTGSIGILAVLYVTFGARMVLRIYLPDVDQGTFVVAVGRSGQVAVFDCGSGTTENSKVGLGSVLEVIAQETSDTFGITPELAFLSISHLHNDHLNLIGPLYTEIADSDKWRLTTDLTYLAPQSVPFGGYLQETPTQGSTWFLNSLEILAIHTAPADEWDVKDDDSTRENNESSAFVMSVGSFDLWVGGDLCDGSDEGRTFCTEQLDLGDVDVCLANHNGSAEASPISFLRCIRPEVVIVQQSGGNIAREIGGLWQNLSSLEGFEESGYLLLQNLEDEGSLNRLPLSQKERTYVAELGPTDDDALGGAMRIDIIRGLFGMNYRAFFYDQGWQFVCQMRTDGQSR